MKNRAPVTVVKISMRKLMGHSVAKKNLNNIVMS